MKDAKLDTLIREARARLWEKQGGENPPARTMMVSARGIATALGMADPSRKRVYVCCRCRTVYDRRPWFERTRLGRRLNRCKGESPTKRAVNDLIGEEARP